MPAHPQPARVKDGNVRRKGCEIFQWRTRKDNNAPARAHFVRFVQILVDNRRYFLFITRRAYVMWDTSTNEIQYSRGYVTS